MIAAIIRHYWLIYWYLLIIITLMYWWCHLYAIYLLPICHDIMMIICRHFDIADAYAYWLSFSYVLYLLYAISADKIRQIDWWYFFFFRRFHYCLLMSAAADTAIFIIDYAFHFRWLALMTLIYLFSLLYFISLLSFSSLFSRHFAILSFFHALIRCRLSFSMSVINTLLFADYYLLTFIFFFIFFIIIFHWYFSLFSFSPLHRCFHLCLHYID